MMNRYFCLLCERTSFLDERFNCRNCGNGLGSWTVVDDNLNQQEQEPENASPGCQVPALNAGNQKSEEGLKVETTREANSNVYEENSNFPLQIAGRIGDENCTKRARQSQNKTFHDLDQYNNKNQNRLSVHSNANEGELHDESRNIGHAETLVEAEQHKAEASQQTDLSQESSFTEGENKISDELLRRQGPKEPIEGGENSASFTLTDSITLESSLNLPSDSSLQTEDRQDKDNIPPPFSSCSRGNPSVNHCVQENMVAADDMAQQKPETSGKSSRRQCEDCGRYFYKECTFKAHKEGYCGNSRKPFKCVECPEIFVNISSLLLHRRVHTGEKPLKCTQCDFASAWPHLLKDHMKTHSKN